MKARIVRNKYLVVGLAIGLGAALALSRVLQSMLFGVGARDPGVFAAVPGHALCSDMTES